MASQDGMVTKKVPLFSGTNYAFWKLRMRTYLMSLCADVWNAMMDAYEEKTFSISKDDMLELSHNAKAMIAILSGIYEFEFVNVLL